MTKASGSIDLKSLNIAGKEVNKYITTINDGGIKVHDIGKQNIDYAQINSNGLTVYQNTVKVAEFGPSIRLGLIEAQVIIGNENGTNQTSHITIDNGGINIYRESDLVMHLGEHTTIGRENKSQLAIENGFLQFSSYVGSARISQFEIGDANTSKTTYTPLLAQEIEIGSSYFTDNNPDDNRWPQGGDFEIFYNPSEPLQPDVYGAVMVEDYYIDDPEHYDYGDPTWYASVVKVCLGELGNNFNPYSSDLYLGFNGDTIVDNYYQNASTLIDSCPIRWFLYTEGRITYLILPLNFVIRSGSNPYIYHWNAGGTELIRPNGRFTNLSIMLYECDNPNASFSSFEPYLTFGNRTGSIIGNYSVTFGKNLINTIDNCFVIGKNNIAPNSGDLFVIGTGSDTSNRANSFKIDGNGYLNVVDGFQIKVNNNQLMTLGTTGIQIGSNNGAHTVIDGSGQRIYAGDGTIQIANLGYGEGTTETGTINTAPFYTFGIRRTATSIFSSSNAYKVGDLVLYGNPQKAYVCKENISAGAWDGGNWENVIGNYSVAESNGTIASGYSSHAENNSKALAFNSHAENEGMANGANSHAEGGGYITGGGLYGHAQNQGTIVGSVAQTAIGTYNIENSPSPLNIVHPSGDFLYGAYAFIIGNGTSTSARSNAMTVDWNGNVLAAGKITSPLLAGIIQMYGGSTIPTGWLECNGQSILRSSYPELFAAIGTTWGSVDSTHFNLPDLRGRTPIGAGTGTGLTARTLGSQNIGTEDAIVPYHRHASYKYVSEKLGSGSTGARIYNPTGSTGDVMYTGYAGTSGNATGANMQPSAVVKFIICTGK